MTTPEELKQNIENLQEVTQRVFNKVIKNVGSLPKYSVFFSHVLIIFLRTVRELSHFIYSQVENKFPNGGRQAVCSFIFLRFICPAIFTPEEYKILPKDNTTTSDERRGLVLVSKVLQKLASGGRFGKKEGFMEPLNQFLEENEGLMHKYLDEVADWKESESGVQLEISEKKWKKAILGVSGFLSKQEGKIKLNEEVKKEGNEVVMCRLRRALWTN